jgi:hypothetical protein
MLNFKRFITIQNPDYTKIYYKIYVYISCCIFVNFSNKVVPIYYNVLCYVYSVFLFISCITPLLAP